GPAVNAQLNSPQGIGFDPNGNLYIADSRNNRVRQVICGIITTFAGDGTISPGGGPSAYGDGGPATSAQLHLPMGVAVDKTFNVYIADTGDNTIREVTTDGNIATIAGDSFPSYQGDAGLAIKAELHGPEDIAVDSSGNLYIADSLNCRIRKAASGGSISTFAGNGTFSYSGDGGAATQAQLNTPQGVAVDTNFNVYIADTLNNVVRKVSPNGTISNYAGNGGAGSSGDGSAATSAQLHGPQGLAID